MATFKKAIFKGYLNFAGAGSRIVFDANSSLSLRDARIEAPEKFSFHSVRLKPNWFVDADPRKVSLTNIQWESSNDKEVNAKLELNDLNNQKNAVHCPTFARYRLLSIACRQLADNAETNNRFEEASMFRKTAMETEWLEKKARLANWIIKLKSRFNQLVFKTATEEVERDLAPNTSGAFRKSGDYFIHGLYRWTSFYGESWVWALGVLLLIVLVVFPAVYALPAFQVCPKEKPLAMSLAVCESRDEQVKKGCECEQRRLGFGEAVSHSLMTSTFQSVDYRKPTTTGEIAVTFEKVLAPLQAALFALALRRKFMR